METRSGAEAVGPSPIMNRRLGRGLESLTGNAVPFAARVIPANGEAREVPIDRVRKSTFNPRETPNEKELNELANSIREKGILQPIIVRPMEAPGFYEIVAGERRWRAAQLAALRTVPVIVRSLTDNEALEFAIIENVQREDLNAIEEASGYRDLIEKFAYTQEKLSQIIGKSRPHLANTMRLLKLPPAVQALVKDGALSAGHARALIGHEDAESLAKDIVRKGLNVRDVEALVMGRKTDGDKSPSAKAAPTPKDADSRAAEREMSDALGLSVVLNPGSGEAGEVIIRYKTLDQFETIRKAIMGRV
jgi:ParB family chromosome partitioning protein